MLRTALICPTYNAIELHRYTVRTLTSFFETTPDGIAIVVDDGSAGFIDGYGESLHALAGAGQLHTLGFPSSGRLTRSWNAGLAKASELKVDYAIAGNNDIIFTPRWYEGLLHALTNGYAMVGPLSNAPGTTAQGRQEVTRYVKDYRLSDNSQELARTAEKLRNERMGHVIETHVNGFFQMASMPTWEEGKFDSKHFYRPVNNRYASGKRNPTPLMTGNEDEIQHRWHKKGWKSCIALSSFIFHYRAVSRGEKHKKGMWFRQ